MENASKALLMAGGVMLTMLVISLLLYAWTAASEYQANQDRIKEVQALAEFNQEFTNYQRDDVQGYELISLVNKVIDYNQRFSEKGTTTSSAGNSAQYKHVKIKIKIDDSSTKYENRNKFTRSIVVPAVARTSKRDKKYDDIQFKSSFSNPIETKYQASGIAAGTYGGIEKSYTRLFSKNVYEQNDTNNEFKSILDNINDIAKDFGGDSNAQSLSKSIGSIYEGKVIDYNGQPEDLDKQSWYQESYIESRYKTLTGKNEDIKDIRSYTNITKILQYYEYMEFKKAEFKCTRIDYDDNESGETNTGRVIEMDFEIIS